MAARESLPLAGGGTRTGEARRIAARLPELDLDALRRRASELRAAGLPAAELDFGGRPFSVAVEPQDVAAALSRRFRRALCDGARSGVAGPAIEVTVLRHAGPDLDGTILSPGRVTGYRGAGVVKVFFGHRDLRSLEMIGGSLSDLPAGGGGSRGIAGLAPEDLVLALLELDCIREATAARRQLLFVHGAALAAGGRIALLLGASGSGKSTLAAALALEGLALLGDDTSCVDSETLAIVDHPRRPRLRPAGRALLPARAGPHDLDSVLDAAPAAAPAGARVSDLFFLEGFAAEPRVTDLPRSTASFRLAAGLVERWDESEGEVVARAARVASSSRAHRLVLGPPVATAGLVRRVLEDAR